MARPTPKELVARLKGLLEATTDEDLTYRLREVHGLRIGQRDVQRYTSGKGMGYERAVELLDIAGYLTDPPPVRREKRVANAESQAEKAEAEAKRLRRRPQDDQETNESEQ